MTIRIGKRCRFSCEKLSLGDVALDYVDKVKYLGIFFVSAYRFKPCFSDARTKFFKTINGILGRRKGFMNDIVMLFLLRSKCLPFLLYGCESFELTKSEFGVLESAWNAVYWKLFRTSDSCCISNILMALNLPTFHNLMAMRKCTFERNMLLSSNRIMSFLVSL